MAHIPPFSVYTVDFFTVQCYNENEKLKSKNQINDNL